MFYAYPGRRLGIVWSKMCCLSSIVRWQNINVTENGKYIQLHHSFHPGLNPGDQLRLSDASGLQYPQCKHLSSACEQFLCRWEDTRCSPSQCHHALSKVSCSSFGDGCVWGQKQYDVTSTEFSSDISSGRSWATLELAMNDDKFSNVENSTTYRFASNRSVSKITLERARLSMIFPESYSLCTLVAVWMIWIIVKENNSICIGISQ